MVREQIQQYRFEPMSHVIHRARGPETLSFVSIQLKTEESA